MKLNDKIVLITGASSGLGAATALAFDRAGAKVAIAARRKEKLDELAAKMKTALVLVVDLTDEGQTRKMIDDTVAHFGKIDVLVNNAASIIVSAADSVTSEDMMKSFRTNLIGPMIATQQALKYMRKQGRGHIINVGSPGFMVGVPFYAPYVCSKAALSGWTRTIQAEWADTGIIVSEYFPGYTKIDSKPESRLGDVEQDMLFKNDQNFLSKIFTKPKTADDVANDLVKLVIKPKILVYTGFTVRIGAWIANIARFRLNIAKEMAKTGREKLGRKVFED